MRGAGAECVDEQNLRTCAGGAWQARRCDTRCVAGAAGAACAPMAETVTRSGRVR